MAGNWPTVTLPGSKQARTAPCELNSGASFWTTKALGFVCPEARRSGSWTAWHWRTVLRSGPESGRRVFGGGCVDTACVSLYCRPEPCLWLASTVPTTVSALL